MIFSLSPIPTQAPHYLVADHCISGPVVACWATVVHLQLTKSEYFMVA